MAYLLRSAVSLLTGLIATLGTCNGVLAQQRPTSDHVAIPVIGVVNWIAGNVISVATDGKVVGRQPTYVRAIDISPASY